MTHTLFTLFRRVGLAASAALLLASVNALAAVQTYTITHTHRAGDDQSVNEARERALQEIKRKALEKAGSLVQVHSVAENFRLTRDEVTSVSAGVVRLNVLEQDVSLKAQTLVVTVTAKAEVDPDEVRRRLEQYAARLAAQHNATAETSEPTYSPGTPAASTAGSAAPAAPRLGPRQRANLARVEQSARAMADIVAKGMSPAEVAQRLGPPTASRRNPDSAYQCDRYGRAWVVYRDELLVGVRTRLEYRPEYGGDCHAAGFAYNFVVR